MDLQRYYKVNEYFLSAVGIWPYQTRKKKLLLCSIITFCIVTIHIAQVITVFITLNYNYLVHKGKIFNSLTVCKILKR